MFKRMARMVVFVSVMFVVSGCYSVRLYRPDVIPATISHVQFVHTFFWGIASPGQVNVSSMCGTSDVQSVHSRLGGAGLVAYMLTAGVWAPMTVTVVCSAPKGEGMTEGLLPEEGPQPAAEGDARVEATAP